MLSTNGNVPRQKKISTLSKFWPSLHLKTTVNRSREEYQISLIVWSSLKLVKSKLKFDCKEDD